MAAWREADTRVKGHTETRSPVPDQEKMMQALQLLPYLGMRLVVAPHRAGGSAEFVSMRSGYNDGSLTITILNYGER